jgi:hypothetical protein
MELIFDDTLFVHYRFVYLSPAYEEDPDLDESRRGQVNGLLGAAVPGVLSLVTGTHTGDVPFRVEWHDTQPPLDGSWEDVVEASFDVAGRDMRLAAFDDAREVRVPAIGPHRVRLCAAGFQAGTLEENVEEGEPAPDRYLLQLWPAPAAPDAILRVSGQAAQYWHDETRGLTAIPDAEWQARQQTASPPDDGGYEPWAPAVGRGLPDEQLLRDIPGSLRMELREPLARRACAAAGIAGREPIRSALQALRDHQPLPPAMTSIEDVLDGVRADTGRNGSASGGWVGSVDPVELAVQAVFVAADSDTVMNLEPLLALAKAATGMGGDDLVREVCAERGYG